MVSKEFLNGTCAFYTDPYAAGEQSPAILRETFDTNQPRPLPPTRIQTEAHPLPLPKPLVLYQDPLPSADSAGTNRSKTAEWHFASDAAPVTSAHGSFTRYSVIELLFLLKLSLSAC
jgi:hypothetical protein